MSQPIPITCPSCGIRLGSQVEDNLVLLHQGHKRALVGEVRYIKCRRPLPREGGGEMHCPGEWVPQVLAHA
jgi:hypothetical protein